MMSATECNVYEMIWWERYNMRRQLSAFGKVAEIRLVGIESREDDDIV